MNTPKSLYNSIIRFLSTPDLSWKRVREFDCTLSGALSEVLNTARSVTDGGGDEDELYAVANARLEAERAAIVDAYHAANNHLLELNAELRIAVENAEWGRQPDGTFITDRRSNWSGGRVRTLYINRMPVVEVYLSGRVDVRTLADARALRDAAKATRREDARSYGNARQECLSALRRGVRLEYRKGQQGGVVSTRHGRVVSASGIARTLREEGVELKFDAGTAFVPDYYET